MGLSFNSDPYIKQHAQIGMKKYPESIDSRVRPVDMKTENKIIFNIGGFFFSWGGQLLVDWQVGGWQPLGHGTTLGELSLPQAHILLSETYFISPLPSQVSHLSLLSWGGFIG